MNNKLHVIERIKRENGVSADVRKDFFSNMSFQDIRNWLEENNLNRHLAIELTSTEVAVITPDGILLQVRATDSNQLGMWGGVVLNGESPEDGAVRELKEETGMDVKKEDLEFVEVNRHFHCYDNHDKAVFNCHRFILRLDKTPEVIIDHESNGFKIINTPFEVGMALEAQREFLKTLIYNLP